MEIRYSMESEYSITPDTVTNNILVDSWCRVAALMRRNALWNSLMSWSAITKGQRAGVKPDSYTFRD
jgi:hypothetical protein